MSKAMAYEIPKGDLYWEKIKIDDEIFALSHKLDFIKTKDKVKNIKKAIIKLCNISNIFEMRMKEEFGV